MQKVATVTTERNSLRDEIIGWTLEDGNAVVCTAKREEVCIQALPIWKVFSGDLYSRETFPTVLHGLGLGWKLLAPPLEYTVEIDGKSRTMYDWWLVKD